MNDDLNAAWAEAEGLIAPLMDDPVNWDADQEIRRADFDWRITDAHATYYVDLLLRGRLLERGTGRPVAAAFHDVAKRLRERISD